jgi:hypothetical protein
MCWFHVQQACQKQLTGVVKAERVSILSEVSLLHSCVSQHEFDNLYRMIYRHWSSIHPEFAYYFQQQWNSGNFTCWKVFNCEPGVANTNNALELFNGIFKKNYTSRMRLTLPALCQVIIERFIPDVSLDLVSKRKVYEVKRIPDTKTELKISTITDYAYKISSIGMIWKLYKYETQETHTVDVAASTCTCKHYHKKAYCKHLLFAFKKMNRSSDKIFVDRIFKYKGNTRKTQRSRGRVSGAAPALQQN